MTTVGAVPIYEGQDFYVPYFEVKLDKRPIGQDVIRDILQVTYKDNIQELDSFEIVISNWDAETRDFKYSDLDLFDPGKDVELWMGYYGQGRLMLMIKGEITSLRPTFPSGGGSTLTISGLNILHRLRREQRSQSFDDKTDSEIAIQIGNGLDLDVVTDRGSKERRYNHLSQQNQYDIVFLMERARRGGFDLYVEEQASDGQSTASTLHFGRSVDLRYTTYKLTYGKSLIEFQPELTTANQVGKVTVRGWDAVHKTKIEYTATRDEIALKGVGERGGQPAINRSIEAKSEVVATKPVESQEEAETLAREIMSGIAKEMVKGTGSVPGLPDLRAGSILMLDGMGKRFSGRYFVVSTTHTIGGGGYTTQFECRREEV